MENKLFKNITIDNPKGVSKEEIEAVFKKALTLPYYCSKEEFIKDYTKAKQERINQLNQKKKN